MDAQSVIKNVTERIRETANVQAVFGEPVKVNDVTIIPVACVKLSGGGGGGQSGIADSEADNLGTGLGMGMRVTTTPVGYIEIVDGEARMMDVIDKNKLAMGGLLIAGALLLTLAKLGAWKVKHT